MPSPVPPFRLTRRRIKMGTSGCIGLRGEARDRIFEPRTIAGFGIQRDMITGNALLFRLVTLMAQFALECIQPSERGLHYRCTFGSGSAGMIESLFGDPADFV
jgi:hypothetical protein